MKIISKPIEMLAWFDTDGIIHPVRFRVLKENGSYSTIKIEKVLFREKLRGIEHLVFRCQSIINEKQVEYEIRYELQTCRWLLYQI